MKLEPASLAQVRTGRDGRRVCIDEDVFDVARRLAQIDPSLSLHWNERGEYFVVVETGEDGRERLVTTTTELDGRLIEHVERLAHPSYDFVGEMDRMDAQARRDADHRFHEQTGEVAERLAYAVRKDLQAKNRIFLPEGV